MLVMVSPKGVPSLSKLIYIAGPYTAPTKLEIEANINQARNVAVWCAENKVFYICPHLNSAYFEQWVPEVSTLFYYAMDEEILSRCDAIVLVGKWLESKGCKAELEFAAMNKKRIFYFDTEQKELLDYCREN